MPAWEDARPPSIGGGNLSYDDLIIPRTPSGYHDDARGRLRKEPKHDLMQAEVLKFLRGRVLAGIPEGAYVDRLVEGEYPIVRRGQVVAYADAIEIASVNLFRTISMFEIKPVIDTVFGIIRQAKALLQLASVTIPGEAYFCHVVVPAEDPLLPELRAEWPRTWAWGAKFEEKTGGDE